MKRTSKLQRFERHHQAILLFILIAGIFLINILAFQTAYDKVVSSSPHSDLQPARIDYVVTKPPLATAKAEKKTTKVERLKGLDTQLIPILKKYDTNFAIVVQDLTTGEYLGINDTTTFVSASLYKLFVGYEVVRQLDMGIIKASAATGFEAGSTSITDCLDRMLSYSDNDCGRALRKLIGADDAPISTVNDAGFYGTSLINDYPTTSAKDVALFFEKIYTQTDFPAKLNAYLLNPLLAQEINNRLPVGLPDGQKFAHKTADLDGYSHDAGIVYSAGGDYNIIVLSGPWDNGYSDSPAAFIAISKLVYDWFNPTLDNSSF